MNPHPYDPHPWRAVKQKHTPHAIAVHRDPRNRKGHCDFPDFCRCPACRNRWLLVVGRDSERWAERVQREQGEWMTEMLRVTFLLSIASGLGWYVYLFVQSGGTQL